ncbi:nucleotide exchange factor GrpE [bacterium (Candidatus Gribaldobacteria) CG_4_9_14_3_um_filter_36_15]|uniref:Protein GrpE n=4 Tax=Candidatus Gribaldobacteria TaxID=2798536 RepID=A0A2H0UWQ9_9BACT|nr:MAG: nucleotide exchange factor GrpE [Parcubacteria group bacterium CG2_30_36_21]PIR91268.1 MAG: nucleotide exchange factor GrpE [bacterium (Candidatus Gribaldobacteria) CG10_big_fil_rev_8_21_14_0_10_37_46]PIV14179.1 MAG: nucleotide exchange factor GrpE [bacterium (Candidatus Gribaldobacteria) CG03_land_8_20_14_0_80_36_40]PJB09356.1 MAG: nucleotide exchange factor GrpE [bacterium (Candidatus Gribaldobacteria) CG_4_9_14_3_um_filter_36_15]
MDLIWYNKIYMAEQKKEEEANKKKIAPKETEEKLKKCQKLKEEYLAGWQRARADFLNYKKEEMERLREVLEYGSQELILKILPVLDNLEKAEAQVPLDFKDNEWVKGISQIRSQLQDFLRKEGVEEIKTIGKKFDPNFMEVIEEVNLASAKASAGEAGIVIEEIQKGYILNGRVIRPARVKIIK